ncbi:hypothetical protein LCGC14_2624930 [marine sediment metagenome]|uniref:Uncharacterized protein n=1 Tax=marine sediment metagenome TaxID=412755 RepID=A0A0F9CCZ8_9ZZZZ
MSNTRPRPGLYQKFNVDRIVGDDKPGEEFFVLSPTHDPIARSALKVYAAECRAVGLTDLANDLDAALERASNGEPFYPPDCCGRPSDPEAGCCG